MQRQSGSGCLPQRGDAVGTALADFWNEAVRSIPNGARLLDLGCGNGAAMQATRLTRSDLQLIGVDAANLDEISASPGLRFHFGTSMEALPFADKTFNIVISQFGLEYAPPQAAIEAVRVLKPGGSVALCLHDREGQIYVHNKQRSEAINACLAALYAGAEDLRLAEWTIESLRTKAAAVINRFPAASAPREVFGALLQIAAARLLPERKERAFREICHLAEAEMGRISQMLLAALSPDDLGRLTSRLRACGIGDIRTGELRAAGNGPAFAFTLIGRKPS